MRCGRSLALPSIPNPGTRLKSRVPRLLKTMWRTRKGAGSKPGPTTIVPLFPVSWALSPVPCFSGYRTARDAKPGRSSR
jgi:hypothetical protein